MSKISQKNKELKATGKTKVKTEKPTENATSVESSKIQKCYKCNYFTNHPGKCSILKAYRARKADACDSFKTR